MQHPAPQSEDRRDRAEPGTRARAARSADRRPRCGWRRKCATTTSAPSSSWSTPMRPRRRRGRLRVHRGESAPAGRAHGHRRGDRHRSRQAADCSWRRAARSRNSGCSRRTFRSRAGSRCRCASTWNRWARTAARSRRAGRSPRSRRRRDRACASIRSPMPDTRPVRASTRCSPS